LHNEFLIMRDGKMSKSAGKFVTLDDVIAQGIHPLAYRWFLLGAHYRSQVEFSMDKIAEAGVALRRVMERFARAGVASAVDVVTAQQLIAATDDVSLDRDWVAELLSAAANDLATPELVAVIADLSRAADTVPTGYASAMLGAFEWLLGVPFSTLDPSDLQVRTTGERDVQLVRQLAVERDQARVAKDWARADEIRAQMEAAGFEVRDTPDGTVWS
jgi:cysteinyl-tRNA synthetase